MSFGYGQAQKVFVSVCFDDCYTGLECTIPLPGFYKRKFASATDVLDQTAQFL